MKQDAERDAIESLASRLRTDAEPAALERLLEAIRPAIFALALRFLWHPDDAEDATQEILMRIVTKLRTFRGESAFRTWMYRVATNALLTARKKRMERRELDFGSFGRDLADGLSANPPATVEGVDDALLLEEVKIGCTLGMLLCLDRAHRIAYILGEILELDQSEAADVLEVPPATYRKRLSRARQKVVEFTRSHCGLVNMTNPCRCRRRVERAVQLGRVDPRNLRFATDAAQARRFPEVLREIRSLEETRRAAALIRSQHLPQGRRGLPEALKEALRSACRTPS